MSAHTSSVAVLPDARDVFPSFLLGGFECSCQRLASGRRIDMVRATHHARHASRDYKRLAELGIFGARDGLRWHLIEEKPGTYDFSSVDRQLLAAKDHGIRVAWDLCHYGWPDDIPIFRPAFVNRIANFAAAFVEYHLEKTGLPPVLCPVNEISFFAWAGGQVAMFNPTKRHRGDELKAQLVRASLAAIEAAWLVDRRTRILHTDPMIHVLGDPSSKRSQNRARAYHEAQFQSWDMISGRWKPELGGKPEYLDLLGVNYYPNNQWMVWKSSPEARKTPHMDRSHPLYRPMRELLMDVCLRYQRPLFVAETGTEGDGRADWFRYVCEEVRAARAAGAHIHGICLYPIVNHPGWTNNRHCHNGLWDYSDPEGNREPHIPLMEEIRLQAEMFEDEAASHSG